MKIAILLALLLSACASDYDRKRLYVGCQRADWDYGATVEERANERGVFLVMGCR